MTHHFIWPRRAWPDRVMGLCCRSWCFETEEVIMNEQKFGELRSLLSKGALDVWGRHVLWGLIEDAAIGAEDQFRAELLPYLEPVLREAPGPLAVVRDLEWAQSIVPFAEFERSLVPEVEALEESLRASAPATLGIKRSPPLPTDQLERLIEGCEFNVEPALVDLFTWCDGFEVEWFEDRDKDGQPYDDEYQLDMVYRRLTLHGARSYFCQVAPEILGSVDTDPDEYYVEFRDGVSDAIGDEPSDDEITNALATSTRVIADYTSNANDLTCSNIRLNANGQYEEDDGEWELEASGRTRSLTGCTSSYIGSMILRGAEFSIFRDVVDSEIAEVVTQGPVTETSLSSIVRALVAELKKKDPARGVGDTLYWYQRKG